MSRSMLTRQICRLGLLLAVALVAILASGGAARAAAPQQGTIPQRRANLIITKSVERSGNTITYRLDVRNAGPSAAQGVVVVDRLPPQVALVSVLTTRGRCAEAPAEAPARRLAACYLGNMAAAESAGVTIVTRLRPNVFALGLRNIAVAFSATPDPDLRDNIAWAILRLR
jgi:uncharacterized repeat protein (TIGR01451 family)